MSEELSAVRKSTLFDSAFYLTKNPDVSAGSDPALHYLKFGGFEGRNPGPSFSSIDYLIANPDVARAHINPLAHYELYGRQEGRKLAVGVFDTSQDLPVKRRTWQSTREDLALVFNRRYAEFLCTLGRMLRNDKLRRRGQRYWTHDPKTNAQIKSGLTETAIFSLAQDLTFPSELCAAEKVMVIVIPERNIMSGGIYSLFSIAQHLRRLKRYHDHEIIIMTRPTRQRLTYFRNTNFTNSENVYRFEQITLCRAAREIYLHIPEYAIDTFATDLSAYEREYLLSKEKLHINVLNQNIRLMPPQKHFDALREMCGGMSQSVAHHAYFTQEIADKYNLPTLLLPAFTDLSAYPPATFDEKEKLIIYSPDFAAHKSKCIDLIARNLPEFRLLEIQDITFDEFMDLATRCMFSISFGEGFDGYLAQPIHQGGISFTVYNDEFFPSAHFKNYFNIFKDEEEMTTDICARISYLMNNEAEYKKLNLNFLQEFRKLYSFDQYMMQLRKLALREFELYPQKP